MEKLVYFEYEGTIYAASIVMRKYGGALLPDGTLIKGNFLVHGKPKILVSPVKIDQYLDRPKNLVKHANIQKATLAKEIKEEALCKLVKQRLHDYYVRLYQNRHGAMGIIQKRQYDIAMEREVKGKVDPLPEPKKNKKSNVSGRQAMQSHHDYYVMLFREKGGKLNSGEQTNYDLAMQREHDGEVDLLLEPKNNIPQ